MIEATCAACGTLNRVLEANVPVGAKFFPCADCKARVAIPQPPAVIPALPSIPGGVGPPPRQMSPAKASNIIDIADLPAPKRASALGPVPAATPKSAMRSGLAAALDAELPAPKARSAGPTPAPPLDLDDLLLATPSPTADDSVDLPAPKKASARSQDVSRNEIIDLPAPKAGREVADLPAPKRSVNRSLAELPAPRDIKASIADLPTPRDAIKASIADLPAPKKGPMIADLPTPRAPELPRPTAPTDIPAPKGFFDDLPQPARPADSDVPSATTDLAPRGFFDGLPQPARPADSDVPSATTDLAPRGFFDDLPQPARPADGDVPSATTDLAPKGFFDDLPQPARPRDGGVPSATTDLAPKGFFDDLPQPTPSRDAELPAPKGYFDDLPQPALHKGPELPAPKGFFDDRPQVKPHPSASEPEVPAPKGFFHDIPGLPHTSKPEVPAPKGFFENIPGLPSISKPEVPAPKGYFENIPGRTIKKSDELAPKGFFDDLPQPTQAPSSPGPPPVPAAGRSGHATDEPATGRDDEYGAAGPELDLVSPSSAGAASFDDLDLSSPSASPVRFEQRPRAPGPAPVAPGPRPALDTGLSLDLEGAPDRAVATPRAPRPVKIKPVLDDATAERRRSRRKQLALGAVLAAVLLGGGGFVLYRRHAAAAERTASIAEQLASARASYAAADPQHWQRAAAAARRVIDLDDKHPEAIGIAAESLFASVLVDGTAAATKIGQARAMLDAASRAGLSSPQIVRARALAALVANQPDGAIGQLQALINGAPKDAALALYLGWALAAKGDVAAAIASYDRATSDPAVKVAALYGRGNAKLALADLDGARADFAAILETASDHIAAQVGLAAALPPGAAQQQESDVVAILARKDIAAADPRAIVRAWTLAGDAALRAGRGDVARERFRKALAIAADDPVAMTGLAETDLREGNLPAAAELIGKVLATSKDNVTAQLVQSELEIKQNKLPIASQRLAALANHATPLTPLEQSRLHMTTGKLLEAQGKDDEAVESYALGAKAARDLDLTSLMAAVGKLAAMTAAAVQAKDLPRAEQLRARADQLLGELAAQAEHDPRLALTLGMAYLQEGDATKAQAWLRRAADARPSDAEARFQLGRALLKASNHKDALDALHAALGLDPARADIAADLARTYEALGRDADAGALYSKLLAGKDPSLELRARAGRFFARTGALDKAGEQGAKILDADPRNPAGLYLKGEGLLAAGKPAEARQSFQRAIEIDRDPQYLDALGRAAEALAQGGDRELQDLALRSYMAAAEAAPTMFNPLAGQGRLYVARHEAAKAVTPLLAAAGIAPKNSEVMFLLGAAYQELQQAATALQWLEQSMRISPSAEAAWRIAQLYRDGNQGQRSAAAVASATRLAAESEKRTGNPVAWLTDALYLQGRVNLDLHHEAAARDAWLLYVARNPPASAQLTEVKQLLATQLR